MSFVDRFARNQPAELAILSVAQYLNELGCDKHKLRDEITVLLMLILVLEVRDKHDELLEVVRTWARNSSFDSGFPHPLAHEVIVNLERQKEVVQTRLRELEKHGI